MYSRFKALEEFDQDDLERLKNSTAAVVGTGATGSVIAEHLARHGIDLILIDRDYLEENDIYSSSLYRKADTDRAKPKAEAAAEKLSDIVKVEFHVEDLTSDNIDMLENADIVIDGTDNLETRLLISEYCQKEEKPWIYTAAIADRGFSMFLQEECFNCLFEKISASNLETCETAGIMREVSSMAGSRSAWKAVRYLAGKQVDEDLDSVHSGKSFKFISEGCKVCEDSVYEHLKGSGRATKLCGSKKFQIEADVTDTALEKLRENFEIEKENDYLLQIDDGQKFTVFRSGRVIVEAEDEGQARQKVSERLGV